MFASEEEGRVDLGAVPDSDVLCRSRTTLSHGEISGIRDIVYVVPERFDRLRTTAIASEFARCNEALVKKRLPYLAIGFGRWGTSEATLGIPVRWSQISGARVLIETGSPGYVIDPSRGTHFFQNLTAQRIAYLNVVPEVDPMDWAWLAAQPVVEELFYVRHVRTTRPIRVLIDGRCRRGLVQKS